ncbi:MAG TPA: ABC transporter permease [Umezawaea sp.]|nr:ABC transporter permease [Umezawaea sp.]
MTSAAPERAPSVPLEENADGGLSGSLRTRLRDPGNLVLLAVLVVAIIVGASTPRFFSIENAKAICASTGTIGIAALGVTLIMVCGGLVSLAVGETAAVSGMVFLTTLGLGLVPALLAATAAAAVVTGIQGWAIGAWRANPIILTIAVGSILTSIGARMSSTKAVSPASDAFEHLNKTPLGVPVVVFALLGLTVLVQLLMSTTRLGRLMYAVGENRAAAVAAGLPVAWTVACGFVAAGALMAISGAFSAASSHTITLEGANQLTFNAIAAVLAGGTSIAGGFGSATRTLFGALMIATISDLLLLRGAEVGTQTLVKGLLVLVVVLLGHVRSRRSRT